MSRQHLKFRSYSTSLGLQSSLVKSGGGKQMISRFPSVLILFNLHYVKPLNERSLSEALAALICL